MPKKIVQDIMPTERHSIREVPIRIHRKKVGEEGVIIEEEETGTVNLSPKKVSKKRNRRGLNMFASFIIVFACISVIGIALSLLYSKAVVTITPKVMNLQVDGKFTAKKNALSGDLKYEVITATDEMHKPIFSTNGPLIQTKARGIAILFNNYSATTQKIVAGTRLTNSLGLIYRTSTSVSIPGKKTIAGKVIPGSINVGIIADQSGEKYNIKLTDLSENFKIMAYKGTSKYDGFYGHLKSDITGGFSGNKKIVSADLQKKTIQELQDSLKEKLIAKLKTEIPEGYLLYKDSYIIENKVLDIGTKEANSADIGVKSTVYGIIFNSNNLLHFVAGNEIKKFPASTYNVKSMEDLSFQIVNMKDISMAKSTPVIFNLKGPVSLIGTFSEESLKKELQGIKLSASNAIFAKYNSIGNAYALLTPFWIRSFPNSADKIIIEYK